MTSGEHPIQSLTAEELIKEVYHYLNQKSSTVQGIAQLLAEDDLYGFTSDAQKNIILLLHKETKFIREVTDWLLIWMDANLKNPDGS